MKFHCTGAHQSFLSLLAQKLEPEESFETRTADATDLGDCDAIIFGAHESDTTDYSGSMQELKVVLAACDDTPVIVFLPGLDRTALRSALSMGAYDHFTSTTPLAEISFSLRRAASFHEINGHARSRDAKLAETPWFGSDFTTDPRMLAMLNVVRKVAPTDAPVLITGESGVGKEVVAKVLHNASPRASQPFVAVACSSLPETLIEAELFGHEKGAFTGATGARPGRFEAVGKGTLLLDEIGELSPSLQVKLLRVLQERTFERIGSNQSRPVHARLLYATNRDLRASIREGTFRQDFFYRISTVELHIPPLRERRSDILVLASTFLRNAAERMGVPVPKFTPGVMSLLQEYDWPGNIRQLQNVIERAVLLSEDNNIRVSNLPPEMTYASGCAEKGSSLELEVRRFKKRMIERALMENAHNKVHAARALGIARSSLHRLIEELQIVTRVNIESFPETKGPSFFAKSA
ncbi:MAG TPA: sigma-54 dependent transcriptional regulator [Clostridia bacterium]|nr:sigma-54 dependent transcriptional regulator [Clostridia bacterium]